MSTNLTIDDFSPDIIYSSDWAPQSSALDPNTDRFFQSTYHSAQGDGASANLTFIGSAIYLYGSKGPGHANYSVQFDNFIIFYSASDSQTLYQQPLFGHAFNTSGTHFVSFTAHYASTGQWLDLDYITITVNETDTNATVPSISTATSAPTASPTISPPWLLESSSSELAAAGPGSTNSAQSTESNGSASTSSKLTLVLAAVFGALIVAALIFVLGFCITRKGKGQRSGNLRVGTPGGGTFSSYKPPSSPSFFGGPMSPSSADVYSAHSPASRTDPFHSDISPAPEHDAHIMAQRVHGTGVALDGRHSPFSFFSLGGATVLTAASSAQLLNPHLRKTDKLTHKQSDSETSVGIGQRIGRTRSPLQRFRRSSDLPIYKQHRLYDSESALGALRGAADATPDLNVQPISEKPENSTEDAADAQIPSDSQFQTVQPPPLPPLHATHRPESDISSGSNASAPAPPRRPKRPGDGLLDFIGNQFAQKLERSATAKRRRDDANSERTNFLKV